MQDVFEQGEWSNLANNKKIQEIELHMDQTELVKTHLLLLVYYKFVPKGWAYRRQIYQLLPQGNGNQYP